jgi:hypothetical protein
MYREDSINHVQSTDFILDAKVDGNYLSFFQFLVKIKDDMPISTPVADYLLLNKSYEAVDTISRISQNHDKLYWHDFRINKEGDRLISIKETKPIDLREKTGNPGDSAILSDIDIIQIIDKMGNVKLEWNPLKRLDKNVFQFEESLHSKSFTGQHKENGPIDWSHLTSMQLDYDDNIIYSLRFIGIGKISSKDGSLMWHIDYKDLPIISGRDTIQWFFPHDFNFISQNDSFVTYSLFSLGNGKTNSAGVVFQINKKTSKVKLVEYVNPEIPFVGSGQGGFEYTNHGNYIFSYGIYDLDKKVKYRPSVQYTHNGITSIYNFPDMVNAYRTYLLNDWPVPDRPQIVQSNNTLSVVGKHKKLTWYKLSGPNLDIVTMIGDGDSISASKGAVYCVETPYGIGHVVSKSYMVK